MAVVNLLLIFKMKDLMKVHYKNNVINQEIWLFYGMQNSQSQKVLDKVFITITMIPIFNKDWLSNSHNIYREK